MKFDLYLDTFHAACGRKVFTNDEIRAAYESGVSPADLAKRNDELADEYDAITAEEEAFYGR